MKIQKLTCPNCTGSLELDLDKQEYIFCPYCGQKFFVDDGKKEYIINQNINIKKSIEQKTEHVRRTVDEAELVRAKTKKREASLGFVGIVLCFAMIFGLMFFSLYMADSEDREEQKAIDEGKISAGSSEDYEGENYESVVEQLKTLGFEDITVVDLDDAGIFFWREGEVESISIGGDTQFNGKDYYEKDVKVIVKHH